MTVVNDLPTTSDSPYPNSRSAAGFQVTIRPFESAVTMASVAELMIASSNPVPGLRLPMITPEH
jgi:hypothetical protein